MKSTMNNRHETLLKLRNLIKLYEKKIFTSDDPYAAFMGLIQFNDIHEKAFGHGYFDLNVFHKNHPRISDKLNGKLENNYIEKYNNYMSFCNYSLEKLPNLLDSTIEELDFKEKEIIIENDIDKDEIVPLVNEFFKYENVSNPNVLNEFIKDKRIVSFNNSEDYSGLIYFDILFNKDYICINTDDEMSNLSIAATCAHECGHELDVLGLSKNKKAAYVSFSPYLEASSHFVENKFYDFLLKENINKNGVLYEKLCLLSDINSNLNGCITYFDELDKDNVDELFYFIGYGYGEALSLIIGEDKEAFDTFRKYHHDIYDVSLLEKLNVTEDKCKKVFCKELNKIYK